MYVGMYFQVICIYAHACIHGETDGRLDGCGWREGGMRAWRATTLNKTMILFFIMSGVGMRCESLTYRWQALTCFPFQACFVKLSGCWKVGSD